MVTVGRIRSSKFFLLLCLFAMVLLACGGGGGGSTQPNTSSSNANLSGLSTSEGVLTPLFGQNTTFYTVDNVVGDSIQITAALADINASLTINGNLAVSGVASGALALTVGANNFDVTVTAEDGTTIKNYNITVNRVSPAATNANLSSLSISAGTINPVFDPATLNYTVNVADAVTSTTVTTALQEMSASMTVNGSAQTSGVPSSSINLNIGSNPITILVTAADGVTTKTYTVTVIRADVSGANANLSDLVLSDGTLTPVFLSGQLSYSTDVSFAVSALTVTPTAEDSNAVITVNSLAVTSGQQSQVISLAEGANVISISVTSANGLVNNNYEITVTRQNANQFAQHAYIRSTNDESTYFGGHSESTNSQARAIAIDGDTLAVGTGFDYVPSVPSTTGGVHVYVRNGDTWNLEQHILSTVVLDAFGDAVDLSGDTLVVGAINTAAVHVYTRTNGVWSLEQTITESTPIAGGLFGASVAVDGDTLAVGAPLGNAVYTFTRTGSTWSEQQFIQAATGGQFGQEVVLDGSTLVVNSPVDLAYLTGVNGTVNGTFPNLGAVHVYTFDSTVTNTWIKQAYIKNNTPSYPEVFGKDIAIYQDTLAVSSMQLGSVYIYTRNNLGIWSYQTTLQSQYDSVDDAFGVSIALGQDVIVVGAEDEDSNATTVNGDQTNNSRLRSGAAYVFSRTGSTWLEEAYLKAENAETSDNFGAIVDISGDSIAITASGEKNSATGINPLTDDNGGVGKGAVYIFR